VRVFVREGGERAFHGGDRESASNKLLTGLGFLVNNPVLAVVADTDRPP
jgi:hypothetical protein